MTSGHTGIVQHTIDHRVCFSNLTRRRFLPPVALWKTSRGRRGHPVLPPGPCLRADGSIQHSQIPTVRRCASTSVAGLELLGL